MSTPRVLKALGILPAEIKLRPNQQSSDSDAVSELRERGYLTYFQAERILAGRVKQLTVGDYVLLDQIGQGGMGRVFLARHRTSNEHLVLKTLTSGDSARQHREARLLMSIRHPCVVPAIDYFHADQDDFAELRYWLVMKWLPGPDLARWITRHGAAGCDIDLTRRACKFARHAARGLAAAHKLGIVHRDVKPANLILDEEGCVRVADFGIAGREDGSNTLQMTVTGQLLGTTDYLAPEQAHNASNVDRRADIYSLGCTLFHLLEGRPPYEADDPVSMVIKHAEADLPRLTRVASANDRRWLERLIHRMMAKSPDDRFNSCDDVAGELRSFISGRYKLGALTRRRWLASSVSVGTTAMAAWAAWPRWSLEEKIRQSIESPLLTPEPIGRSDARPLSAGILPETQVSPTGRSWQLHTAFPTITERFELAPGRRLCANLEWDRLRIVDVATRRTVDWFEFDGRLGQEIAWVFDDSAVVATLGDGSAVLCELSSGQLSELLTTTGGQSPACRNLDCHPFLPLVALTVDGGGLVIVHAAPSSGQSLGSFDTFDSVQLRSVAWSPDGKEIMAAAGEQGLLCWRHSPEVDSVTEQKRETWSLRHQFKLDSPALAVAYRNRPDDSSQQNFVATACLESNEVIEFGADMESDNDRRVLIEIQDRARQIRWTPDGATLFWDRNTGRYFPRNRTAVSSPKRNSISADPESAVGARISPESGVRIINTLDQEIAYLGWPIPRDHSGGWPDQIGGVSSMDWSASGDDLLVCSPHCGLQAVDPHGRFKQLPIEPTNGHAWVVEALADDRALVLDWRGVLQILDLKKGTGRALRITRSQTFERFLNVDGLAIAPDEGWAVISSDGNSRNTWLAELDKWQIRRIADSDAAVRRVQTTDDSGTFFCSLANAQVVQRNLEGKVEQSWKFPDTNWRGSTLGKRPGYSYPVVVSDGVLWQLGANGERFEICKTQANHLAIHKRLPLVACVENNKIRVLDLQGVQQDEFFAESASLPRWHPTRPLLALRSREGTAATYSLSKKEFIWSMLPLGPDLGATFSPDGRLIDGQSDCLNQTLAIDWSPELLKWTCTPGDQFQSKQARRLSWDKS